MYRKEPILEKTFNPAELICFGIGLAIMILAMFFENTPMAILGAMFFVLSIVSLVLDELRAIKAMTLDSAETEASSVASETESKPVSSS